MPSFETTCFRCGATHCSTDRDLSRVHRSMKKHDMDIIRKERARIRAALTEGAKIARSLTPGAGGTQDEWWGGVGSMLYHARRAVRT